MTTLVSWSGGKDSCLALHAALRTDARIDGLLCMLEECGERSRSHRLPQAVLLAQAQALGLPLYAARTSWQSYETVFRAELAIAKRRGVSEVVFGDIDLEPHRKWAERICAEVGLRATLPLWGRSRQQLALEILAVGIEAIVVCVDHKHLPAEFCGRRYDAQFLADLPPDVDPCGEQGEFHTCVLAAPGFRERLPIEVIGVETISTSAPEPQGEYCFARLAFRATP